MALKGRLGKLMGIETYYMPYKYKERICGYPIPFSDDGGHLLDNFFEASVLLTANGGKGGILIEGVATVNCMVNGDAQILYFLHQFFFGNGFTVLDTFRHFPIPCSEKYEIIGGV